MTDYKQLCAELVHIADALDGGTELASNQGQAMDGYSALAAFRDVAYRARAALAEPEVEGTINWPAYFVRQAAVQEQELKAALAPPEPEEPTDEEIMELMPQQMHEDLAAAVQAMAEQAGTDSTRAKGMMRIILNGHVVDHSRAVLARWGK